ncbi:polyphosphate polymerase domain-containing protein [Clostridium formicaceticum]|uniref:Molecular chaperone n=1 Tax=Clostridium formicaceticum TaxID=1497 RepID=A0AAC9RJZ8_9CLOT|nr:polyphosphate polymerase domain-containing protein [Clostridium formicaceticum]AOY76503.1 molecular chaperone [Clostridium formicaceticum]ARE86912.1 VTC domain protein [Clostridium formicaceticum]
MAKEVFNRYENKFLVHYATYQKLQDQLLCYMEVDEFNKSQEFYTICNIYYDTKDDYLIRNSLAKPKYKEKLRLRAYGIPREDEEVYLEVKKKVYGLVNKRRTKLKLKEAYAFAATGIKPEVKPYMNPQVLKELEYVFKIYGLEPRLYLAYDRKAFFSKEDKDLRITFDTNIRTRRYDLKLEAGDYGENLLEADQWLMEIKAEKSIPVWLSKILSENKVYKTSFSKYGAEYQKMLFNHQQGKGEIKLCLNQYLTQLQFIPRYL